jgi:hypothetical protein
VGDARKFDGIPFRVFRDGARCLCLAASAASRGVWLVFKVVGRFATAFEVAARETYGELVCGSLAFPTCPPGLRASPRGFRGSIPARHVPGTIRPGTGPS